MLLSFREQSFPYKRTNKFKVALGNTQARYNSEVISQRKKVYINSTRNSEDVPQWMNRTQRYFLRSNTQPKQKSVMYSNPESSYLQTKQKWIYQSLNKSKNPGGQFQTVSRTKARSKWQMKGNTFQFEWPQKQSLSKIKITNPYQNKVKTNSFFKYQLPKYGIKQSPLHRQRQTQIKIGHPTLIDSVYVQ